MKGKRLSAVLMALLFCGGCSTSNPPETAPLQITANIPETDSVQTETDADVFSPVRNAPQTNDELFTYIITLWQAGDVHLLYPYAADSLQALMAPEDFTGLFTNLSRIGGDLLEVSEPEISEEGVYTALLTFTHIRVQLSVTLQDVRIHSFLRDISFTEPFTVSHDSGVSEQYFILESDGLPLNAVYTYADDGAAHPAVLLIAGSGPADYNGTVGVLTPLADIALGLAEAGISSLRLDKRTLQHADTLGETGGLEEEYFRDCRRALAWLSERSPAGIYLLGHSLGGQIAASLAAEEAAPAGMILLCSTARHIADVFCDQYTAVDPAGETAYTRYAQAAKTFDTDSASELYYYGVNGYYWASYNRLDTVSSIREANIPTLIVNTDTDNNLFPADLLLWQESFGDSETVTITVLENLSHFGYAVDTRDPAAIYRETAFPQELIRVFTDFIP